MNSIDQLEAVFAVMLDEVRKNTALRERLEAALSGSSADLGLKRRNRRESASVDPFKVFESDGEVGLRTTLGALDLEQLKDVIAGYDMDRDRLALKWRSPERLIERIVETVAARRRKGDAFLGEPPAGGSRIGRGTAGLPRNAALPVTPNLEDLYMVLRGWAVAKPGQPRTYTELAQDYKARTGDWFEPHGSWDHPLGELNRRLHAAGAPALSALVIVGETKEPGRGFWGCAGNVPPEPKSDLATLTEWQRIVADVLAHAWPATLP